jgi:molybdopterin-containing oxidoreductase family membrane subunit|tara:strand:+ start:74 stop:1483 length:1410 start_codon:yes stop_codon:yes gene_type:complete
MASELVTHDHKTELHTPPPEVAPDVVTRELVATTSSASNAFKRTAWILGLLSVIGIAALLLKWIDQGNDSTRWGYVAALVAFLLSVAGGAPMVAMAPVMAKANWVRPVTRLAAMFSFASIVTIIMLIPLVALLPPLMTQGALRRTIWFEAPDYSPHVWAVVGLILLLVTGIFLFYSAAIPDFATMRDHSTGWRRRWGKRLARGWVGTDVQWRTLRMRIGMFGTFYFLILVFVQFLITTDFGQSMVPGWRDAIFPMYHTISSLQSGVAAVVIALWLIRRNMKLEKYIHADTFWSLGRLLFALTLLWVYFFYSSFIVFWYGRSEHDIAALELLVKGPMLYAFISGAILIWFVPWWILIWNKVRRGNNMMIVGASIILIGVMLDRIRIFVPAWSIPPEQIHEKWLHTIPDTVYPDIFDILIMGGGLSLSALIIMMMTRVIPALSVWQVQEFNLLTKPIRYIRGHATLVGKPD